MCLESFLKYVVLDVQLQARDASILLYFTYFAEGVGVTVGVAVGVGAGVFDASGRMMGPPLSGEGRGEGAESVLVRTGVGVMVGAAVEVGSFAFSSDKAEVAVW